MNSPNYPRCWAVTSSSSGCRGGQNVQAGPRPKTPNLPIDGAAGIIINTIFGPVELAAALGEYGRGRFFFRIGRIF